MPTYTYKCKGCGYTEDTPVRMAESFNKVHKDTVVGDWCYGRLHRDYKPILDLIMDIGGTRGGKNPRKY